MALLPSLAHKETPSIKPVKKLSLIETCQTSIKSTDTLKQVHDYYPSAHLLHHKPPYLKSSGKWGLDFKGRGRLASCKNMQVACHGEVVLQMAAVEKNMYALDFKAPVNLLQAFGFAVAQVDL
jgi:Tub family